MYGSGERSVNAFFTTERICGTNVATRASVASRRELKRSLRIAVRDDAEGKYSVMMGQKDKKNEM